MSHHQPTDISLLYCVPCVLLYFFLLLNVCSSHLPRSPPCIVHGLCSTASRHDHLPPAQKVYTNGCTDTEEVPLLCVRMMLVHGPSRLWNLRNPFIVLTPFHMMVLRVRARLILCKSSSSGVMADDT